MDKNNLIGFGLIGLVLFTFIYFNQPDPPKGLDGFKHIK